LENKQLQNYTDKELIALYQKEQDRAVISELLERYYHLIYGACCKILDPEDAKDVCIDICESLFEKLKTAQVEFFSSWVYTICHNRSVSFIREKETRRKHERQPLPSEKSGENIVENQIVERLSIKGSQKSQMDVAKDQLSSFMSQLPKAQRFCLQLFYFKNLSYAQIAEATNSEIKQVKSHLQSGKRKLKLLYEAANERT